MMMMMVVVVVVGLECKGGLFGKISRRGGRQERVLEG
jgi:hypothetical protein